MSIDSLLYQNSNNSFPLIFRGIVKRKEIHEALANKQNFYYIDTGYFGNFVSYGNPSGKKRFHRIVKNELQKTKIEKHFPADRWERLIRDDNRLKWTGWKTGGKNILLVLPNPKSCNFFNFEYQTWYDNIIKTIKENTDRPIIERIKGSRGSRNTHSIYDALNNNIHCVVAFNSIAAMESVAYGIPAFVSVPCAAWNLASNNLEKIETPFYPDADLVQEHCRSLSYGQFTEDEVSSGIAWKLLQR